MADKALIGYYRAAREACEGRWGADFRKFCWGSMIYACAGALPGPESRGCGWDHRVLLGVGVEGPPELREAKTFIPCPMFCGQCPNCGGRLAHDQWSSDEEWEPREIPDRQAFFYVPSKRQAKRSVGVGYGGAEYKDPTGRTTGQRA